MKKRAKRGAPVRWSLVSTMGESPSTHRHDHRGVMEMQEHVRVRVRVQVRGDGSVIRDEHGPGADGRWAVGSRAFRRLWLSGVLVQVGARSSAWCSERRSHIRREGPAFTQNAGRRPLTTHERAAIRTSM